MSVDLFHIKTIHLCCFRPHPHGSIFSTLSQHLHCLSAVNMLSVQQPDLTQTIKNNTNPLPNNNHTGSMEKMPMYLDNAINTNKSLLLDETARMSSERLPQRRSKISMKSSECDSRPQSAYSVNRHSILGQLPSNMDPECLVWATVSHTGGRITLPDSGMSFVFLFLPS